MKLWWDQPCRPTEALPSEYQTVEAGVGVWPDQILPELVRLGG